MSGRPQGAAPSCEALSLTRGPYPHDYHTLTSQKRDAYRSHLGLVRRPCCAPVKLPCNALGPARALSLRPASLLGMLSPLPALGTVGSSPTAMAEGRRVPAAPLLRCALPSNMRCLTACSRSRSFALALQNRSQ